jgi:hypothetical protein
VLIRLLRTYLRDYRGVLAIVVVFQTFLEAQVKFGPPSNPAHLLKAGELAQTFADFEILRVHERIGAAVPGGPPCALAGIVAKKPL